MHRERSISLGVFSVVVDAAIILFAFFLSYLLVDTLKPYLPDPYHARRLYDLTYYGWWAMIDLFATLGLLYLFGIYTFSRTLTYFDLLLKTAEAVAAGFLLIIVMLFAMRVQDVSRLLIGSYTALKFLLLLSAKLLGKSAISKLHEHGYDRINALVMGSGKRATDLIAKLSTGSALGYRLVGVLAENDFTGEQVGNLPVLGRMNELRAILNKTSIDEVFFAAPVVGADINDLVFACEEVGVRFSLLADWFNPTIARTSFRSLDEVPMLTFSTTPSQVGQLLLKALTDRIFAAISIALLSPLLLIVALIIKLTSPGPVLFHQVRSGLNGRLFKMYKFRTMVVNAEALKDSLLDRNEMNGPVFKIKDDPRVTRIGHWLRRTSLDELPQLFNILLGDMSVVGPRPPIPAEVEKYERWQRRRLSMKPGLTCFWQIAGRNEVDFADWMKLDLKYIDNWSFKLDIIILLKTIPVVLLGRGAH